VERVLDRLREWFMPALVPAPRARPDITAVSQLTLGIVPKPQEVRRVRREVRSILAAWYAEESVDDVLVVISELVTNAVRHAPCPEIGFTATCGGGLLLIEVEDGSAAAHPPPRPRNGRRMRPWVGPGPVADERLGLDAAA
jgi:hypothetical protein